MHNLNKCWVGIIIQEILSLAIYANQYYMSARCHMMGHVIEVDLPVFLMINESILYTHCLAKSGDKVCPNSVPHCVLFCATLILQ